jgi:ComF family protein
MHFAQQHRCQRCGIKLDINTIVCGECLKKPPPWQRLYCVGDYDFPLSHYVHQMKYSGQFWLSRDLVKLLAAQIDHPAPIITSVPLHWQRYIHRGFNQSTYLANALAQELNCQSLTLFRRRRATPTQQGLSKTQRQRNLRNVFSLRNKDVMKVIAKGDAHVAIIDDVVTTGSTVYQLCQLLLEVGVKRIDIYCICRTPEPAS